MHALLLALVLPSAALAGGFSVESVQGGLLTLNGQPVGGGAELKDGASLHLTAGKAVLDFEKEGKVLLTGPSDFTVEKRGVNLKTGGLLSVLSKLKGSFEVSTHAAVAAVRGTEFYVEARGENATYVCICDGKVDVSARDGSGKPVAMKSKKTHKSLLFSRGGAGLSKKPAKMEGHTDAEIAGLKK